MNNSTRGWTSTVDQSSYFWKTGQNWRVQVKSDVWRDVSDRGFTDGCWGVEVEYGAFVGLREGGDVVVNLLFAVGNLVDVVGEVEEESEEIELTGKVRVKC